MENLIQYLYIKHINSKDHNVKLFSKQQSIKSYTLSLQQLQFYNSLYIRNILTYSASTMQFKLSLKHLFGFYRLHKFESIMKSVGLQYFFKEWIDNQMMPISLPHNKKIPNNSTLVYADFQDENQKQEVVNKQVEKVEKVQQKKTKGKGKSKQKAKEKQKQKQKQKEKEKPIETKNNSALKQVAMINVLQLTTQLQNKILSQQLDTESVDIKKPEARKQLIQQYQRIKIEQYINQRFDSQTLMTFNFIQHYPYIDQKQLLKKTMLSAVQLRKCLGNLITDGIINFYPQNSKSILYKSLDIQRIKQLYLDHIAQSILNLYIYLGLLKQNDQQKVTIVLSSLSKLDDILMIFML